MAISHATVRKLHGQGMTVHEMAVLTGAPRITIRARHQQLGLEPHGKHSKRAPLVPVEDWDDVIISMRMSGESIEAIGNRLGVSQWPIRNRIAKINANRSPENKLPARVRRSTWSEEELRAAVAASSNMTECIIQLGLSPTGAGNWKTIEKYMRILGIEASHWGKKVARAKRPQARIPLEAILVEGSDYGTHHLKQRLLKEGVKEHVCEGCGLREWCGHTIPLELDHVNGDNRDHRMENLRMLCPNCHALTPTWRGRNIGRLKAA